MTAKMVTAIAKISRLLIPCTPFCSATCGEDDGKTGAPDKPSDGYFLFVVKSDVFDLSAFPA